jgi:hypothetical protein
MPTENTPDNLNAIASSEGKKKVYQTPRLTTLGGVHQLVQAGAGSNSDGTASHLFYAS